MRALRFAVLIPAHDEAASIERKIEATHAMRFEKRNDGLPHVAVVIDDHSADDTLARARAAVARQAPRADLEWRVIESHFEPGKGSALRAGFEEAAGFDVLVITDADAMVSADAPVHTARVLRDPAVGAATASQRYVERIEESGIVGNRLDAYDRASEAVRWLESEAGALFSVHGPWLALRAATGARPVPGVAADDLDLALQVRAAGFRVVLVPEAHFWEVKPRGDALLAQQIRRARAYFEVMDRHLLRSWRLRPRPWGALQFLAYAVAPPLLALGFLVFVPIPAIQVLRKTDGAALPLAAILATAGLLMISPLRECLRYSWVILAARLRPHRARADRWGHDGAA